MFIDFKVAYERNKIHDVDWDIEFLITTGMSIDIVVATVIS